MAEDAELSTLDEAACLQLLRIQHVGRLVVMGEHPEIVPLNYAVVDGMVRFRHSFGESVWFGGPVLFEVDMFDERSRSGWSVIVHGELEAAGGEDEVDSWAGATGRWRLVPVTITGRLLRGATDARGPVPDQGYL